MEKVQIIFDTVPTGMFTTSFRIITKNGQKISIGHSLDTGGELETILVNQDNTLNHDSLIYHNNREDLVEYILSN